MLDLLRINDRLLEIDKTQVYRAIKENLPDIVHYCQAIEIFLKNQTRNPRATLANQIKP